MAPAAPHPARRFSHLVLPSAFGSGCQSTRMVRDEHRRQATITGRTQLDARDASSPNADLWKLEPTHLMICGRCGGVRTGKVHQGCEVAGASEGGEGLLRGTCTAGLAGAHCSGHREMYGAVLEPAGPVSATYLRKCALSAPGSHATPIRGPSDDGQVYRSHRSIGSVTDAVLTVLRPAARPSA